MVAKTHLSRNDLVAVLSHYDVGHYQDSQALSSGTVQTNHLIETTQSRYVLKYYENRPAESVAFETNLLNYILKRKFPCPVPIKKEDATYMGIHCGKPFVLYEYIEGQHITHPNEAQQKQIIKTAATLQNITKNYRPQNKRHRWNYNADLCLRLVHEQASRIGSDNAYAKAEWFEETIANLDLYHSLPKGICHCDYDYSNLLFDGDELIALLDFDDANFTYLLFDLVMLVHMWAWSEDGLNIETARQIIQEYACTRTLFTVEKQFCFDVHKLKILFDGIWFFDDESVDTFRHRRAIEYLDSIGREAYQEALFA